MPERETSKREQIMAAAGRVFARAGFEAAKVDDIAREAGVGKGTVYEYFDSKQALFEQILFKALFDHMQRLEQALAAHDDLVEALQAALEATLRYVEDRRELARVLNNHPTGGTSPEFRRQVVAMQQRAAELVRAKIAAHAGDLPDSEIGLLTHQFLGLVKELSLVQLLAQEGAGGFIDRSAFPDAAAIARGAIARFVKGMTDVRGAQAR